MLYTVYAIASIGRKYVYIGMTDNLERRMKQHQNGLNRTTKPYRPFEQIYTETFSTRWEAREREKKLKTGSEREKLYLLREKKIDKSTRA
ncbi:MAG TPA: GIY-YIG nuclease family protein [Patescibacteria group bacterium]|nr:GIY-YIG nuclease family protein [Patescibacteria group bacterium]